MPTQMAQIHLTCLETGGWGFGLDSSLVEASSHGPCSLWACCAVRGSVGGRLSLLAPYDVTAGSLHGWRRVCWWWGVGREVVVEKLCHLFAHRHSRTTTAYCLCKIPLSPAAGVDLLSRLSDSHSSPGISFMNLSHFNKVYYTILSLLWNKHRL